MDREIFIKYFEGNISLEEEKRLLAWIDESEENREIFLRERQVWDMLLLNFPEEKTLGVAIRPSRARKIITEISKIAAIFAVAIFISHYFWGNQEETPQAWNTIEVPVGQRTQLTLSDGTKVWLNAKTRFTFPDRFTKSNREVKLDGEAFFDVAHNEKVPFIVETEKFNVKVLGTEFNVYAYRKSGSFETTLLSGKVVLDGKAAEQKSLEIKPGEMARYNEVSGKIDTKLVDTQQCVYWREGVYSFENESLGSIFQRLERYYGVEFEVQNTKILNARFSGKFRYRDPIEIILEVVKKSSKFRYSIKNNKITIY